MPNLVTGPRLRPVDRLPLRAVAVRGVAEQEFCEMKIDLELRHPEVAERQRRSLRARNAVASHVHAVKANGMSEARQADEVRKISPANVSELARSRRPFTLIGCSTKGRHGDLPLIGQPDAVHFDGRGSAWIVHYRERTGTYCTPSDAVELQIDAYLMRQRKTGTIRYALVCVLVTPEVHQRMAALQTAELAHVARAVSRMTPGLRPRQEMWAAGRLPGLGSEVARWMTFGYDVTEARQTLEMRSGYWLGTRKPVPSPEPIKCARCRANAAGLCRSAAAAFDRE